MKKIPNRTVIAGQKIRFKLRFGPPDCKKGCNNDKHHPIGDDVLVKTVFNRTEYKQRYNGQENFYCNHPGWKMNPKTQK